MLENTLQNLIDLAGAYGYVEILPRKVNHMLSFQKEEDPDARINFYFTTGTVQVQYKRESKPQQIHRKVMTPVQFEEILQNV